MFVGLFGQYAPANRYHRVARTLAKQDSLPLSLPTLLRIEYKTVARCNTIKNTVRDVILRGFKV